MGPTIRLLLLMVAVAAAAGLGMPQGPSRESEADRALRQAIVAAEYVRAEREADLAPIRKGLRSRNADLQALAVRALGRLERPALARDVRPLLDASSPRVRAEAANALGRLASGMPPPDAEMTASLLLARLSAERDPEALGVACATLGRLPLASPPLRRKVEDALVAAARRADPGRDRGREAPALMGAVKGLETLIRQNIKSSQPSEATVEQLQRVLVDTRPTPSDAGLPADRARRLALAGLVAANRLDLTTIERALGDPDVQVRRIAVTALGLERAVPAPAPATPRADLFDRALRDPAPMVRFEALRVYGRRLQATGCGPVYAAVDDPSPHVSLFAIDLLANPCPAPDERARRLTSIADRLGSRQGTWHAPAHAIVSLAKAAPDQVGDRLSAFAAHPVWQVRMYAAHAATTLADVPQLRRLAEDASDNVREAAVGGLSRVEGHRADEVYLSSLEREDYQLIRTATLALKGSPLDRSRTMPALFAALARLTSGQRDTSRDPRLALVDRIGELGSKTDAERLAPLLNDFDPAVGERAEKVLYAWTGERHAVRTFPRRTAAPSLAALEPFETARIRVVMAGGPSFALRLFVGEAPAAVARFVGLLRKGYYNGLTFHRVVPNFIIQGGSPGANEFEGDASFMNDEIGLRSNLRGTVGISTRGRDTGDAQFFINLVDNQRLDHDYTIFAEVVEGMEVVDGIVEGDLIARMEILEA